MANDIWLCIYVREYPDRICHWVETMFPKHVSSSTALGSAGWNVRNLNRVDVAFQLSPTGNMESLQGFLGRPLDQPARPQFETRWSWKWRWNGFLVLSTARVALSNPEMCSFPKLCLFWNILEEMRSCLQPKSKISLEDIHCRLGIRGSVDDW